MSKNKTTFECIECGVQSGKWFGKCLTCGKYNTANEVKKVEGNKGFKSEKTIGVSNRKARTLDEIQENESENGFTSKIKELDRVLGGQIIEGSLILIGGEPGKGKSTLLSTVSSNVSLEHNVFYASGEESELQVKKRMVKRMGVKPNQNLKIFFSRNLDEIEDEINEFKPKLAIVDSINTVGDPSLPGNPGDIAQIKHCINRLMNLAKSKGISIIVVSQVTKDGEIAGPKSLEHMVDTVLYLEGEKYSDLRLLRTHKNRFGSSQELGVFKMEESGLIEVNNPSEYMLKNRPDNASGSGIICVSDSRPLLVEVQALVSIPVVPGTNPRRSSEGFSRNRLTQLTAVLERRCGIKELSAKDIYINVVGGLSVEEPGADLGVAMTIYSSNKDLVIDSKTVLIGEVGLAGEVRPVSRIEQLVKEAARVGFERVILPDGSYDLVKELAIKNFEIESVKTLNECIKKLF